jgi:hypothetical protein
MSGEAGSEDAHGDAVAGMIEPFDGAAKGAHTFAHAEQAEGFASGEAIGWASAAVVVDGEF